MRCITWKKGRQKWLLSWLLILLCFLGNVHLEYCSAKYSDLLLVTCDWHVYKPKPAVIHCFLPAFQNSEIYLGLNQFNRLIIISNWRIIYCAPSSTAVTLWREWEYLPGHLWTRVNSASPPCLQLLITGDDTEICVTYFPSIISSCYQLWYFSVNQLPAGDGLVLLIANWWFCLQYIFWWTWRAKSICNFSEFEQWKLKFPRQWNFQQFVLEHLCVTWGNWFCSSNTFTRGFTVSGWSSQY